MHIVSPDTFMFHEIGDGHNEQEHGDWHKIVSLLLNKYKEAKSVEENWKYWLGEVMNQERWLFLKMLDSDSLEAVTEALFQFDQAMRNFERSFLFIAEDCALEWAAEMVTHFRAQLCLNYALVNIKHNKSIAHSLPLLLLSHTFGYINNVEQLAWTGSSSGKILSYIQKQGFTRKFHIKNIAHIYLKKFWPNDETILNEISSICSNPKWRENVYFEIFNSMQHIDNSNFVQNKIFETPSSEYASLNVLKTMFQPSKEVLLCEIAARPNDVDAFIQLVHHYLKEENIEGAFEFISITEIKSNRIFFDSHNWYTAVSVVLDEFAKKNRATLNENWLFWFQLMNSCERRLACLPTNKDLLFELDQLLFKANQCTFQEPDREFAYNFLPYFQGQFYLHAALVLLDFDGQPQAENWSSKTKTALPLLWLACKTGSIDGSQRSEITTDPKMKLLNLYAAQSNIRILQAENMMQSCDEYLNEIKTIIVDPEWQIKLFHILFGTKESSSSHLTHQMKYPMLLDTKASYQIEYAPNEPENVSFEESTESVDNQINTTCSICGIEYSNISNLNAHTESMHKFRRYLCSYCPDSFTAMSSLRRHSSKLHPGLTIPTDDKSKSNKEYAHFSTEDSLDDKIRDLETKIADKDTEIVVLKEKIQRILGNNGEQLKTID